MNVVFDLEEAVGSGIGIFDCAIPDIFASLDLSCVVVQVALSIKIEVNSMVAECRQYVLAVLLADRIRGPSRESEDWSGKSILNLPHVRWKEAEDRVQCNLVPHYLVRHLSVSQLTGVLVGPSMAGNLVAPGMHSL